MGATAWLAEALRRRWAADGERGAAPVVVPLGADDALGPGRDPWAAERAGATAHLSARALLVGPWGAAHDRAACGRCLAMRWQRLRTRSEREALEGEFAPAGGAGWPVLTDHAVDAAWAVHRAVAGRASPDGLPRVTRIDLGTLALATFPLLPEPLCPSCVTPGDDAPEHGRLRLDPTPKPAPDAYRTRPLDALALPEAALANPVCGVLGSTTHLNPASTTTAPISGSAFVRGYAGLNDVTFSGQADAYATSRTLAYLEGLERYAGTHARRGLRPLTGSLEELVAEWGEAAVVDPRRCGLYAPETYTDDPVLDPFDPTRPIPWIWGHSVAGDRPVLVPARLVHYSAGLPSDNFVFECSNGCATGGSSTEAVLFGLLELVERDAFLLAWYGRRRLARIDPRSTEDARVRGMLDRAALLGYQVRAFDTRSDLGIPVVTALAVRRDGGPGLLSFGAAASLDPAEALAGALSEVLTYIPHLPYQVSERRAELEAMAVDFDLVRQLKDHAQLYGLPRMAEHAEEFLTEDPALPLAEVFADWARVRPATLDLRDDLRLLTDALAFRGHEAVAVDQTTPEQRALGLRTVATLAPGLLPLDFGWRRQRALLMPRLLGSSERLRLAPHPFP
ncbi:TOMM precursor leader peptide-binding protein [Streptomyces sp. 3MP-14]|uniref:TOMM leader peptide-binding protein n=1 Tax=Streptomyces mimosae TaxID=2586635 RepID=A0A5N6AFH3_9ACTN|nr:MULTISPECIES: TOMM precursor leader peptide-binding protein [Streptomyces]KAB8166539.1 TOMM precursor leader peptide-binding protein [Streptomyces mimosae]KAB8174222.1 TOMM precursor leader peptide-binding protein [Streptomyces sp. 3MP-14]